MLLGGLADLPGNALAIIVQHLDLRELKQLDAATMAQVPVIRERRLQMQYAGRWSQLTRRMPAVARSVLIEQSGVESDECSSADSASTSDSVTDFEAGESSELEEDEYPDDYGNMTRKELKQLWGQLQQMSKHSLLQTLLQQICHINDVAALVDNWVAESKLDCFFQTDKLGHWWRRTDNVHGRLELHARLEQLHNKVLAAFSIGHTGFTYRSMFPRASHPEFTTLASQPEFTGFAKGLDCLKGFHDHLLFFCAMHRLQQLPRDAVLARLHSIFSRCCRCDLLLLTCVACYRELPIAEGISSEAHADDILTAFGAT